MVEIVSDDVMDWARDFAALRKLFADEPPTDPHVNTQATILQFGEYQHQQTLINSVNEPIGNLVCPVSTSITADKIGIDQELLTTITCAIEQAQGCFGAHVQI